MDVVLHKMIHFLYPHHNKDFYDLLTIHMQVCENDAGVRLIQSNGILPALDFSPEIGYNSGEKFFQWVITCVPLIIPN